MTDKYEYDLQDLVISAIEQKPLDFETAFNDLILNRIQTAVHDKKIEVAQQMYGYEPEVEESDVESDDQEQEVEDTEENTDGQDS